METRKELICNALRAFVRQRPGFDPRNYGGAKSYRGDVRPATRALRDAETLIRAVELRDSITADDILSASKGGRLDITENVTDGVAGEKARVTVDWCAGQYWCTEFRPGVARVMASVLWDHVREHCMPEPDVATSEMVDGMWPGDWLRAHFRREFGRGIADKYFN